MGIFVLDIFTKKGNDAIRKLSLEILQLEKEENMEKICRET